MLVGAAASKESSIAGADAPTGQQVAALTQSDFVLLVLLLAAIFYACVAVIYRLALGPSKQERLRAAQARTKRD